MLDYLYDGTFEGLLTCVYYHYYKEKASGIFLRNEYQSGMLGGCFDVETDPEKAMRVYEAIEKKISPYDLRRIYHVFLSSVDDKENKILKYILLGFKEGPRVSLFHGQQAVLDVQQAEKKVTFEVHRLCGLIRFSELAGGVLYAVIEPDHDITELLASHFVDRFKKEAFIIHDKKRNKALIAQGGHWYISLLYDEELPGLSADEELYRSMWKKYFDSIAIKERTNPRCQRNFMPVRYWKNLTEML